MAPSLPDAEIATRKGEVITAIRQDDDNPLVRASEALMERLYPDGHPYGRRTKGSIDVVERITREQLLRLHAARFAPSELSVAMVGDVEPARAQDVAARVFGGWSRPVPPKLTLPPVVPATHRTRLVIPMMNKAQADIAYGFTTIRRSDPRYYAFWLMNNVFGQYAIGGRLGDSIRERQGMAYYVSSSLRCERRRRTAGDARRGQPGQRRPGGRVDRRGNPFAGGARASRRKSSTIRSDS